MGSKSGILFLHGWGMNGGVFSRQAEFFSNDYAIFAPDYYADGLRTFSLDGVVASVSGEIKRSGIGHLYIVGWSLGGAIAAKLIIQLADIVKGVVFCGFSPVFVRSATNPDGMRGSAINRLRHRLEHSPMTALLEFIKLMFYGHHPAGAIREFSDSVFKKMSDDKKELLIDSLSFLVDHDFTDDIRAITADILIIHSEDDKLYSSDAARRMAKLNERSQIKLIEGSSHAPFFTAPQQFNAMVKEFITKIEER